MDSKKQTVKSYGGFYLNGVHHVQRPKATPGRGLYSKSYILCGYELNRLRLLGVCSTKQRFLGGSCSSETYIWLMEYVRNYNGCGLACLVRLSSFHGIGDSVARDYRWLTKNWRETAHRRCKYVYIFLRIFKSYLHILNFLSLNGP